MSVKIMSRVWEDGPSDKAEILVLIAIADFCNDDGECWPSVASIAKKARMTERGVQKICTRLISIGWLDIEQRKGRHGCNLYRILTPNTVHPEHGSPPNTVHQNPEHGSENPEPRSPKPSRTINEPSKPPTPLEVLTEVLRPETAQDFIAHRKAMKKPVTDVAAKRLVSKLRDCRDPDAVVDESIANGWQGVFPERTKNGKTADRTERLQRIITAAAEGSSGKDWG